MSTAPTTPPTDTIYVNYFDSINDAKTKALMAICSDIVAKTETAHDLLPIFFGRRTG